MGKRRICVVVTARPSYSRIRTALLAIRDHPKLQLQLVLAASALLDRYGNISSVLDEDGLSLDGRVYMILEGENPVTSAKSTGLGLVELTTVLDNLRPHAVVSIGDRFETIATAIAASYMNIPLVHIQGGEITGSIDEKVRHAVTKLADVHLVSTKLAAERVIRMGERPDTVHCTGCPSIDLAAEVADNPALDFDPLMAYGGVGSSLDLSQGYVVVMQHPVTTEEGDAGKQTVETLEAVRRLDMPTLWFWPNVDAGSDGVSKAIRMYRERQLINNVHLFRNMRPKDFLKLIVNARALIGNSSVGIRESAFLGVPVVNIGTRQAGRERGPNVIDVPYNRGAVFEAAKQQVARARYPRDTTYGDGKSGVRIAEALATRAFTTEKRLNYL